MKLSTQWMMVLLFALVIDEIAGNPWSTKIIYHPKTAKLLRKLRGRDLSQRGNYLAESEGTSRTIDGFKELLNLVKAIRATDEDETTKRVLTRVVTETFLSTVIDPNTPEDQDLDKDQEYEDNYTSEKLIPLRNNRIPPRDNYYNY